MNLPQVDSEVKRQIEAAAQEIANTAGVPVEWFWERYEAYILNTTFNEDGSMDFVFSFRAKRGIDDRGYPNPSYAQ